MSPKKTNPSDHASQSDDDLLASARAGDTAAYGELWRRHAATGTAMARRFAAGDLADDLVAEAFTRILSTMQRGGGPVSGFRPYLITTIRNVAARWAEKPQAVAVDDFDQFEDPASLEDPAIAALDRTLTLTAFRALPERWQTVLWYSEVEGLDPHEIAPFLGMTPNATAALSYRARAGLRAAWLQAHLNDDSTSAECRWTTARLSGYIANKLTERERRAVADHLATCESCTIIAGELDFVGSRLAFVLIPLLVGSGVGASLLASLAHGAAGQGLASLASTTVTPAPQLSVHLATASGAPHVAAAIATKVGLSTAGWVLAGTATVALLTGGGVLIAHALSAPAPHARTAATASVSPATPTATPDPTSTPATPPVGASPTPVTIPIVAPHVTQPRDAGVVPPTPPIHPQTPPPAADTTAPAAPIVSTEISNTSVAPFAIGGRAEPGATVTVRTPDGAILSTVKADKQGAWNSGALAGLSPTAGSLVVVATDAAGNHSKPTEVGPISLVPTVEAPAQDASTLFGSSVAITLRGWAGADIQVTLDGVVTPVDGSSTFDGNGTLTLTATGVPAGDHTLGFRYVSGSSSSSGEAAVDFSVTP
jgi:RNA polymerase sigma factor (sigma-70 family)